MRIELPYGKGTLNLNVPDKNLLDVVFPKEVIQPKQPELMITEALQAPLGTEPLSAMVGPGKTIAIVIDDYTRPCPTKMLLPPVLQELKDAGVDDHDICIIVATGTHNPPSDDVIKELVGDKIYRNYMVISNDAVHAQHVNVGKTTRGNEIEILRQYVEADFKILLGDIEYHYFAGYGGTRKSILPGISSKSTIQRNHSLLFEKYSRMGVLKENPIHQEMNEAMHLTGCDFVLSVVQNSHHRIVGAWAGAPELVMDAGVKLVDTMYKIEIAESPDIVITAANGHPHDLNLYQAMKALHTACQIVKPHGVIILVAECPDGHGSQLYVDWLKKYKSSDEIQNALNKNFIIGAHKAYYHRMAVENHPVIFVSKMSTPDVEGLFRFNKEKTPDCALAKAFEIAGNKASVLVVPQGTTTFLTIKP
ncbi:MAG TPA: nickel-dependent lactate racemase [Thermoplasmata archaeon]|jgi:lactate racemase|nr:MAG TPA: nickel-dependent lactate racemase [Thermoplasmata archaeon]